MIEVEAGPAATFRDGTPRCQRMDRWIQTQEPLQCGLHAGHLDEDSWLQVPVHAFVNPYGEITLASRP
jgi:hypothetical protein